MTEFEIHIHGRRGQGVMTAAEMLSVAARLDAHEAQSFPSRRLQSGTPVMTVCRIADEPMAVRVPARNPDAVVVIDASVLDELDLTSGLSPESYVLINSGRSPAELGFDGLAEHHDPGHVLTLDASEIARDYLGLPLPNICLLGGFAALTGRVTCSALETAVHGRFIGSIADSNARAARAAFTMVKEVARR